MLYLLNLGIEDKLVVTEGYGIVVTGDTSAFYRILKAMITRIKVILDL